MQRPTWHIAFYRITNSYSGNLSGLFPPRFTLFFLRDKQRLQATCDDLTARLVASESQMSQGVTQAIDSLLPELGRCIDKQFRAIHADLVHSVVHELEPHFRQLQGSFARILCLRIIPTRKLP